MSGSAAHLLVVEDDADMLTLLVEVFSKAGFRVSVADDGHKAMALADSVAFDAIVTDLKMPKVHGLQFVANVKSSALNGRTPTFVFTGSADLDVVDWARKFNIISVIPKTCHIHHLTKAVQDAVAKRQNHNFFDPSIVTCFSSGISDLLSHFFGVPKLLSPLTSNHDRLLVSYASGLINFSGSESVGYLMMAFDQRSLVEFSRRILNADLPSPSGELIADLVGEICNQGAGRIKANLIGHQIDVNIGLPHVVVGLGHQIYRKPHGPNLRLKMATADHQMLCEFGLAKVTGGL